MYVLTCHANADFDALGSILAVLSKYEGNADVCVVWPGSSDDGVQSAAEHWLRSDERWHTTLPSGVPNAVILVDVRKASRLKHISELLRVDNGAVTLRGGRLEVYDHHMAAEDDVQVRGPEDRICVENIGSCTALVLRELRVTIPDDAAVCTCMYAGIVSDTGGFVFPSTRVDDIEAATRLLRSGRVDLAQVQAWMAQNSAKGGLLQLDAAHRAAYVELSRTFQRFEVGRHVVGLCTMRVPEGETEPAGLSGTVQRVLDESDAGAVVATVESAKRVAVIARSRSDAIDVGQICTRLGGGGHARAAAAALHDVGAIEARDEVYAQVLALLGPRESMDEMVSRHVKTLAPDTVLVEVAKVFRNFSLKKAPVVDSDGRCVGIVDRATVDRAVAHGLGGETAAQVMETEFRTVHEGQVAEAMEVILHRGQRMVPVVSDGRLVGVVTRGDVVQRLISEPSRIPAQPTRGTRNVQDELRKLPKPLPALLKTFGGVAKEAGCRVFVVGGFVRDLLLGVANDDVDLVVEGVPAHVYAEALARKAGASGLKRHDQFQTAVVELKDGLKIDVATARLEYYPEPVALPTVELSSLKMDMYRRDFTINALAVELTPGRDGELVDFFDGASDLRDGVVRVLHSLSFVDDPTRIFRAARFAARLRYRISAQTKRLAEHARRSGMIDALSGGRLAHELEKIFAEPTAVDTLRLLDHMDVLASFLPEHPPPFDLLDRYAAAFAFLVELPDLAGLSRPRTMLLALLHPLRNKSDQAARLVDRLTISGRPRQALLHGARAAATAAHALRSASDPLSVYQTLHDLGHEELVAVAAQVPESRAAIVDYIVRLSKTRPLLNGHDIISLGIPKGPLISKTLRSLLEARLRGEVSSRDDELAFVRMQ